MQLDCKTTVKNRSQLAALLLALFALAACAHRSTLPPSPAATTVIVHVTVVDVIAGTLRPDQVVVVAESRIASVRPSAGYVAPRNAHIVDGRGRFLIPGLWDMHSHSLWSERAMQSFLPLYVTQGVTGIRDMGGHLDVLSHYRAARDSSGHAWPRVVASGQMLDGPEPVQADISIAVADRAEAIAAVDALKLADADFIKVYTLLGRDAYFAVVDHARQVGLPVAGHVPAAVTVEEATLAGQRSIEHLRDEIEPFCRPTDVPACARLAALFRSRQTWQVPTLVVLRNKAHFDDAALATDPRLRYLPAELRAEWLAERTGKLGRGPKYLATKRAWFADESWLIRYLVAQGVPILAGTDAGVSFSYPGYSLHQELELLVEAGMTPIDALRAATLSPAEYLGEDKTMGAIEPGRVADLVLLRADPLADIRATQQVEAVVLRGRLLDRVELDRIEAEVAAAAAR